MGNQEYDLKAKNIFLILFSRAIGFIVAFVTIIIGSASGLGTAAIMIAIVICIVSVVWPIIAMGDISEDINIMCEGDGEHLMPYVCAWLLGFVTFGIYYIYYLYRMQTRMRENAYRYNVNITESGGSIILWYLLLLILFGLGPIISLAIIVKNHNKMVYEYNRRWPPVPTPGPGPDPDPTVSRQGLLRCIDGEIRGASIIMDHNETIIIGREPREANLIINDEKISRKHCSITYDADQSLFTIIDYSRNGTVLGNGLELRKGEKYNVYCKTEFILAKRVRFMVDIKDNNRHYYDQIEPS